MLEALKFVQGAVAKKEFFPALSHFRIAGGSIKGYNGSMALCSPIALDLEATPKAIPFIKAIQTCRDTVQLNLTPTGRLSVKSGSFKAFVECTEDPFPEIEPEGETIHLDGKLLEALKVLSPFIAEDASRPWARGILFRGPSAYATNNVTLIEYWLGYHFPVEVNIPKPAVQELLRIGEEPAKVQVSEKGVTFHYDSGRWLRTQIYSTEWPDLSKVLDKESSPKPLPKSFYPSLLDVAPFVDEMGRVHLLGNRLATSPDDGIGASVEIALSANGVYNIRQLQLLEGVASAIDLSMYPKPCLFFGERVRGAMVGMIT